MGLQLKGDNGEKEAVNMRPYDDPDMEDPWESGRLIDETYHTSVLKSDLDANIIKKRESEKKIGPMILKVLMMFIIVGVLIVVGKEVVSRVRPEGTDITGLLKSNEETLSSKLKVTFKDKPEWEGRIHQYSTGKVTVKATDDIGIVYIDGKQAGVHIESKKYTMFGLQLGDGEKHVYDNTTFKFDNFHPVLDDMAKGKTTTYFYYNTAQNDCVAVTINESTNRVVGLTYFNNYKQIVSTLDF